MSPGSSYNNTHARAGFFQTCKRFFSISKTKQLWVNLYHREIVERNMYFAPYWKHIDHMDGSALEVLVLHSLKLSCKISTRSAPLIIPVYQKRSVTWIRLIQSQWLLVASSDDLLSVITLWSVADLLTPSNDTRTSPPLAEAYLSAPVIDGAVDLQGSAVIFALELRGRFASSISFCGFRDTDIFITSKNRSG